MPSDHRHALFDRWMSDHIGILHRTANGFAEGEDRKDLMQDILLAVWNAMPFFREDSKASTFIYAVAHNAALTWKRSRSNYQRKIERYESMEPLALHDKSEQQNEELLDLLYKEIRKLPPMDRSLALLFLDDLSYREIAEIQGISESNVGVRLTRLKQKLSIAMKEACHGY